MAKSPIFTLVDDAGRPIATTQNADGTSTLNMASVAAVNAPTDLPGATGVVVTGATKYRGFTIEETSGTATAKVRFYDHTSAASGPRLETVTLQPGESRSELYPTGIPCAAGVYMQLVSGAVFGSLRTGT